MSFDPQKFDSNSDKGVHSNNPVSIDDKHFHTVNDMNTHSKADMRSISKEMIAHESKVDEEAKMTGTNSEDDDDNVDDSIFKKSVDFRTGDMVIIDERGKHQTVGARLVFNESKGGNVGSTVNVQNKKEYDTSIDENLPETVTILTTPDGGKLYLVGTAHFSVESQNDVSMIIQAVQPDIVVVELCKARVGILQLEEEVMFHYANKLTYQSIVQTLKEYGPYNGLLHILLFRMAAHAAKQLGMAPGGEFRRAFLEARKVPNCIIHLADRPINVTIHRAVRSLSWSQTIKLVWNLISVKDQISKEDVELCKRRDLLDDTINKLKEEFPAVEKVFVQERDVYLTYSLQLACLPQHTRNGPVPARVVGIVGIGHTPGIMENWGKISSSDIPPIMSIPPQSLFSKILKFTIKASFLGAVAYGGYKLIPLPSGFTLQSIKSSVEGLFKVSGGQ